MPPPPPPTSGGGDRKTPKRRVPDSLRRRTLVSCDRCKLRRIRCVRANENESCASCVDHGLECKSTMPRKQRLYGSVEKLSLRYRALDALIHGLFPHEDTDQVETLFKIAQDHDITMPSPDDEAPAPEAFSQSPPESSPVAVSAQSDGDKSAEVKTDDWLQDRVQERMIPGPASILQYVGPSSSSDFMSTIRRLIAKLNLAALEQESGNPEHATRIKRSTALSPRRKQLAGVKSNPSLPVHERFSANVEEHNPIPCEDTIQKLLVTYLPYRPAREPEDTLPSSASLNDLPERKICDALVEAYFKNLHPFFPVFYRVTFMHQYDSLWRVHKPELGVGWISSLYMVMILGANFLGSEHGLDVLYIQTKYLKLIRERFDLIAFTASLENVQALLLLQLFEHNVGERNTAWLLLGLAGRMAINLGMHREGTYKTFGPNESHTRRIVWWTLFLYDQSLATILARPTIIDHRDVNVRQPNDSVLDCMGLPQGFDEQTWAFVDIATRAKRLAASISAQYTDETALLPYAAHVYQILQELDAWKAQLPSQMEADSPFITEQHRRAVIMLNAVYHHFKSLVTRPFLTCKVNREIDRYLQGDKPTLSPVGSTTQSLSRVCQTSATAVLDCFLHLSKFGLLQGVAWTDYYYVCHGILAIAITALRRQSDVPLEPKCEKAKSQISAIMKIAQTEKIAQIYKVFCGVAFAFADSVGLGLDDSTETTSKEPNRPTSIDPYSDINIPFEQIPVSSLNTYTPPQPPPVTTGEVSSQGLFDWPLSGETDIDWNLWNLGNRGEDYLEYTQPYPGAHDPTGSMFEGHNWPS